MPRLPEQHPGVPAPRYLWAPSPAGQIPGEDHAGASAVRSQNVGKRSKGGKEAGGALPSVPLDPFPRPRSPGRSPPLRPWSFAGFFWKKQKLANGNGWFGVQRGGVSSRFRCILCSRNKKEGRRGTGKLRAAVVGWHGEHLPPGICGRKPRKSEGQIHKRLGGPQLGTQRLWKAQKSRGLNQKQDPARSVTPKPTPRHLRTAPRGAGAQPWGAVSHGFPGTAGSRARYSDTGRK